MQVRQNANWRPGWALLTTGLPASLVASALIAQAAAENAHHP
jgi:hypothetical protein